MVFVIRWFDILGWMVNTGTLDAKISGAGLVKLFLHYFYSVTEVSFTLWWGIHRGKTILGYVK